MNQVFRSPDLSLTTQAAEGLMRRRWTVAEIEAAMKAGIFDEDERFELIGGEIVPMASKGIRHEVVKGALNYHLMRVTPGDVRFISETTFHLNDDSFVEPDFIFFRKADRLAALNPRTAMLAIEVADSSLNWDIGRKALLYANFRIPELWVINVVASVVRMHRKPGLEGYTEIRDLSADETITASTIPGLTLTLSELEDF